MVKIGEREYKLKELTYIDSLSIEELKQKSTKDAVQKMLVLSTGLSEEEINKISLRDGLKLQEAINELNGFSDFQNPTEQKESDKS